MKRKKILALLMVAALCVGTVAGCGSKDTESSKSESGKNENSESSTGDSKDDLSPITFKYYNADGKNTGIGNYTGFPIYGDGAVDENGNPYTPVTRESVIAEYNEEQKAACEAWNVEMLTDIFPQPDEFETPPYSPLWAYATPQEITSNVEILNEIAWPGLVKCVTESVDNFDANWDKLIADYEANGLEETEQMMTDFLAEKIS